MFSCFNFIYYTVEVLNKYKIKISFYYVNIMYDIPESKGSGMSVFG